MATLTTGVVLLRWQLLSAVMMFLASTLNIRFRRSDYVGLAVISSGLGVVSACWFAMGLLGITMADITAIHDKCCNSVVLFHALTPINSTQLQGRLYVKNHQFIQDTFLGARNEKPLN